MDMIDTDTFNITFIAKHSCIPYILGNNISRMVNAQLYAYILQQSHHYSIPYLLTTIHNSSQELNSVFENKVVWPWI
jgi:hypothetical protein